MWELCFYMTLYDIRWVVYQSLALAGSDHLLQCMDHLTYDILKQRRLHMHTSTLSNIAQLKYRKRPTVATIVIAEKASAYLQEYTDTCLYARCQHEMFDENVKNL